MANYPNSLDSFNNPTGADSLSSPSHALQHADANDAIEALEAKVGIGNSPAGSATAGYPLVAGTAGSTSWTTVGTAGINSTGANAGDILTANASGSPSWTAPVATNNGWISYTPTLKQSTTTVTASVAYAKYMQIGKTVFVQARVSATGTGSAGGIITLSLPSGLAILNQNDVAPLGSFMILDAGTAIYAGAATSNANNVITGTAQNTPGFMGAANPNMTIASTDAVAFSVTYEVA